MPFKPAGTPLRILLAGAWLLCVAAIPAAWADDDLSNSLGINGNTLQQATQIQTNTVTATMNPGDNAAAAAANVVIEGANPLANQTLCAAFDQARQKALTVQLSRDNQFFQYQIAGAFAANCVGKLIDYAQYLADGVSQVETAASTANGDPVVTAVTLIAHRILSAVLRQLINNLENQICSITTQLTSAMQSVVQNAICIPSGALNVGGIGNFNVNLNLPNLKCDGIAINPLQLAEIDPATGQPYAAGESAYTAGALSTYGNGGGGYSADNGGPPLRANWLSGTSAAIYGEPDPLDLPDDMTGSNANVNTNACLNIQAAVNKLLSNVESSSLGLCATYVREALEAGGLNTVGHPKYAKDYGSFLRSRGYTPVSSSSSPGGYIQQAGDIIVEQPYPGDKNNAGHIQMFSGSVWASDYIAVDKFGGPGYRANPNYVIYRPGTTTAAGGAGCG